MRIARVALVGDVVGHLAIGDLAEQFRAERVARQHVVRAGRDLGEARGCCRNSWPACRDRSAGLPGDSARSAGRARRRHRGRRDRRAGQGPARIAAGATAAATPRAIRRSRQQSRTSNHAWMSLPRRHATTVKPNPPSHESWQGGRKVQGNRKGNCRKEKARPGGQPDGPAVLALGVDGRSRRTQLFWEGLGSLAFIGQDTWGEVQRRPEIS